MASKQMAFQMGPQEFFKRMVKIVTDAVVGETLKDALDRFCGQDPKERARYHAVFVIMEKLSQQGDRDKIFRFKKLVVWRDEKGDPKGIEADFGHTEHDLRKMGIVTPEVLKTIREERSTTPD